MATSTPTYLGFDIGGTKVAWALGNEEGAILTSGRFGTPSTPEELIASLQEIIDKQHPTAIGIGIAGTIDTGKGSTILCPNIPAFSDMPLVEMLREHYDFPIALDNDARCALIGEVWKGAAKDLSSAVLITVGTGIGGAVMQKGKILPHPRDIQEEVGRIVIDPSDVFPSKSGTGSIESFIGGRNLEERLQISLGDCATKVRENDEEAVEIWYAISYFFIQCIREIYTRYHCKTIIVGGVGSKDLQYYLQDEPPCPVIAATLGAEAGMIGAIRLAIDEHDLSINKVWEG